jgi:hypothetical protein
VCYRGTSFDLIKNLAYYSPKNGDELGISYHEMWHCLVVAGSKSLDPNPRYFVSNHLSRHQVLLVGYPGYIYPQEVYWVERRWAL